HFDYKLLFVRFDDIAQCETDDTTDKRSNEVRSDCEPVNTVEVNSTGSQCKGWVEYGVGSNVADSDTGNQHSDEQRETDRQSLGGTVDFFAACACERKGKDACAEQ